MYRWALLAEDKDWVTWNFKKQRPDKVPGCQDTRCLPTLADGQNTCRENQQCYYFCCLKCCSILPLDTFNSRYKSRLECVPRIGDIKAPDAFKEDNKYCQYRGEIFDVYFRFFAQIKELVGVAVNGWSNLDAQRVFENVNHSFEATKLSFKKFLPKDFEIDWILFNGQSITIIEVKGKMSGSTGNKNFEAKVEQIKRDQIVMQHLLEVTSCENVKINYIIACPEASIEEVECGKILREHDNFFQSLT